MPITNDSLNKDLYKSLKVRGFDPVPKDSEGDTTPVPDEADVFKFTFKRNDRPQGTAWITVDSNQKLVVYYNDDINQSDSLDEDETSSDYDDSWTGFLKNLKNWAQRRQLGFELQNQDHLASDMAQRTHMKKKENISEGYYPMGKQASYSDAIPTVKIVLQHTRQIQEGEQRFRNIARIFLENAQGERILAPTNRPGIAQVYARHLAEGGVPNDDRWNHIKGLCEEYSKMAGFVRAVRGNQFNESAQRLVEAGLNHYQGLRETLGKMRGHRGYNAYFESWTPALMETEGDEQTNLNELFVQETLDPRIESVMPILTRLKVNLGEMKEVDELAEWAENITSLEEEVDTGESDARKTTPSSKEEQDKVHAKHRERMKKLRSEMDDEDKKQGVEESLLSKMNPDTIAKFRKKIGSRRNPNWQWNPGKEAERKKHNEPIDQKVLYALDQEMAARRREAGVDDNYRPIKKNSEQGVAEGSSDDLVYISVDRVEAFEDWMNSEGLETNVPKTDEGTYVVYDYSNADHTSKMYASDWNEKEGVAEDAMDVGQQAHDKINIPASFRKAKGGDWKVSLKDLERVPARTGTSPEGLDVLMQRAGIKKVQDVEESGLQAYLGNKKYGKEGMDALRKAGREGASDETMDKIRDRFDKLDEVEGGKIVVVNPQNEKDLVDWMESEGFDLPQPTRDEQGNLVYDFGDDYEAYNYAHTYGIDSEEADDDLKEDFDYDLKAEEGDIQVFRSKDGGLYSVRKNGKEIADGDFDRGAGGIWISHPSFKGQKFFNSSKEVARFFSSMNDEQMNETLGKEQIDAGQLGPTEKVGPKGAVNKLVGTNESIKLREMDKSQPSSDRGGESSGDPYAKGGKATPAKAKDVDRDAEKELEKTMDKAYKKDVKEGQEDLDYIIRLLGR